MPNFNWIDEATGYSCYNRRNYFFFWRLDEDKTRRNEEEIQKKQEEIVGLRSKLEKQKSEKDE